MNEKVRVWLRRGLLCFALVCAAMTVYRYIEDQKGEKAYENAAQIAFQQEAEAPQVPETRETEPKKEAVRREWVPAPVGEDDPHLQTLQAIDLKALQEVNPDVVGWVMIPDTRINYPIMQGQDNDFYLKHTWEKVRNAMGSIFLEHRCNPDFTEFNTIVYGHNMNSGAMFGDLNSFRSQRFQKEQRYVYIVNEAGVFRYEVFAYHEVKLDSYVYGLSFNQRKTREKFISSALESSIYDTGIVPQTTDRILTLSTCSTGGAETRWVVLARLPMIQTEQE